MTLKFGSLVSLVLMSSSHFLLIILLLIISLTFGSREIIFRYRIYVDVNQARIFHSYQSFQLSLTPFVLSLKPPSLLLPVITSHELYGRLKKNGL